MRRSAGCSYTRCHTVARTPGIAWSLHRVEYLALTLVVIAVAITQSYRLDLWFWSFLLAPSRARTGVGPGAAPRRAPLQRLAHVHGADCDLVRRL